MTLATPRRPVYGLAFFAFRHCSIVAWPVDKPVDKFSRSCGHAALARLLVLLIRFLVMYMIEYISKCGKAQIKVMYLIVFIIMFV